jgi:hypothetical protein
MLLNAQNIDISTAVAVDHRGVDHLPLTAALRLEQRTHHAVREEHAAAAEVTDHVQRRHRRLARRDRSGRARRPARCS